MDSIFYNCSIINPDSSFSGADAVAVEHGVIAAAGNFTELQLRADSRTRLIDLKGAYLYPGFADCHMHLLYTEYMKRRIDLSSCTSLSEVLALLQKEAERIRGSGSSDWIVAAHFNEQHWSDCPAAPDRCRLDTVTGDIPCYLLRCCEHMSCCNTAALECLGLMREQPAAERSMEFFPDGTPTGRLYENDAMLAEAQLPKPGPEEIRELIRKGTLDCAALGLTAIHSDDLMLVGDGPEEIMAAFRSAAEEDELAIRIYEQCRLETPEAITEFCTKYPFGTGFRHFKTVSVKELLDGSLGAHSAFMLEGYRNDPDAPNISMFTDEAVLDLVKAAHGCGYPLIVHCIGDGAVEQYLNALDAADRPGDTFRDGLNHCQIMRFSQLERMAKRGMTAHVQPVFVGTDAPVVEDCVGPELARQSYNWRKMRDLGIPVAAGTDCPVESDDPIANFYFAVTRDGGTGTPWLPENALTRREALEALTLTNAYAAGEEDRNGSIAPGKLADFTILDTDLLTCAPEHIRSAKVLMTVVDGEPVFTA